MKKILHEIASRGGKLWFAVAACAALAAAALCIDQAASDLVRDVFMGKPPLVVHLVSNLGDGETLGLVFAILIIVYGEVRTGMGGFIAVTGAGMAADLLRVLVHRVRPDGDAFSFPSAHSACAFAAAVVLAHRWPKCRYAFYLGAVAVAAARVTLLKHFPSDVLAGGALGMVFGLAGLVVADRIKLPSDPVAMRWAKIILAVLLVVSLIVTRYWVEPVALVAGPAVLLVLARQAATPMEARLSHDEQA